MADKEQVIQALRATLISVKGALTIKQCNRDYRELQGEWIPFKKLGYPSLEKLFLDVPGFKVIQSANGEWYVDAIATEQTQHIAAMVSRQKSTKKTVSKLNYTNRFPKKQGSWRKPASSYTPNNNPYSSQYYRANIGTSPQANNNYKAVKYNYKTGARSVPAPAAPAPVARLPMRSEPAPAPPARHSEPPARHKEPMREPQAKITNPAPPLHDSKNDEIKHSRRPESNGKPSGKLTASQRLSNLRDHLNTVDLIPLQLPAATNEVIVANNKYESSGPVTHVTPAYNLEPPPDSTSSVVKLEWTCRKLGLQQPVYKTHIHQQTKPQIYDCNVKIGNTYSMSSYPDSSPSEELAKEMAALKLLTKIECLEVDSVPTASGDTALACLAELVADHEAGLWAATVPEAYRKKYGENLPSNWQELVENCPQIVTDRLVVGLIYYPKTESDYSRVSLESPLAYDTIDSDLPPLQFPQEDFWNVFVTVANSTIEIWIRIVGPEYSALFEALLVDMANYYENAGTTVDKSMLIQNAWYAINLDDGGWQRAKILEIEDDIATVFLGDHGDDDTVYVDKIKILEPQFRKLPAQAVLCRLEGAEELAAHALGGELVRRRLPGEVLVAAPGARPDPADPSVPLVLYDTSTPRDLNLNKEIVHDFCIAGAFALTQKLCEVEVGCVTDEGRVWVQRAGGAELVRAALALLTDGPYERRMPPAPSAPPTAHGSLYIVRTRAGDWVRCMIISGLDGECTVRTQLVDSGLILRAPLSGLVPLQTFSPALNSFPYQAMQVRLGPAERAASTLASRLRELLVGARVVCRALPAASGVPPATQPHVELFVRTGAQNMLASVNNAILIEYECLQYGKNKEDSKAEKIDHVEALNKKKERIFRSLSTVSAGSEERTSAGALPPPALPALGHCFDVQIAMAANPWNFVVQPNTTIHTLASMMSSLQRECPNISSDEAPTKPAPGELYTVLYDKDSIWYRVIVAGCVSNEMVSVYFCDYGDMALFTNSELRPVPNDAPLARSLPPQAIKARLHDVCPLHQDWTVEDCVRFQELCVEQQFVAICKDIGRDPLNPAEPLLTLELVDTSTDEDHYLNKQLVSEGRARLVSAS